MEQKARNMSADTRKALMLDFLDEGAAAERIRSACAEPVTGSTTDVGDAIAARVGH